MNVFKLLISINALVVFFSMPASGAPKIFLEKGDLLDYQLSQFSQAPFPVKAQGELNSELAQFQNAWDEAAELGILTLAEQVAGRDFERKEYTAWLVLSPLIPMGRPLIINMNPFLDQGQKIHKTLSKENFVSLTHHEVLHFLVQNIEGKTLYKMSPLVNKYKEESVNVLVHLHLMAVQKMVYERLDEKGESLLSETNKLYDDIIAGDYKRAWAIVEEEGAKAFVDELKNYNQQTQ